ncbi:spore cortex-lytic enzyme [Bacillus pseudomycoides]|uniref:Spore cortex-lytic enzyme n=1 Tax=Bacillus pseudomycoides TaxID=64104 RepID=A0AA91V810_9BACI|nr:MULTISPECIES: spore cortex-lytic enzyme [Bacillus]PEB47760.1 spore cortex-lytic enzyme [Bacillus sp. AFS098217]PED80257.1 spore cortex-lytic enzyme [Bacillus pseudomycoides]PEU11700.1 spore cortex-lytic enzyme [Bacillus sp. AFS019443]PEU17905.1 spore cortex-lytic enzyme [Bacillus sp. AFS014408]PFW62579.1 spore cortex-lytic enzyme [Bacillus sp. AFS075034]
MRQIGILKILILLVFIGVSVIVSSGQTKNVQAFSNQVIQRGASGEDVIELQSRLKYNGFYTGKVDGVFGWGTYWALRNFQQKFGLPVDGLAGAKTKQMLVKATKYEKSTANKGNTSNKGDSGNKPVQNTATNVPNGYSQNDIQLMANAVYGESRGEPYIGQVAVAAVILNRVTSASFPNTVSGVIFEPRAFTAVADGQIYLTPNETAKKAVLDAINGWDPTGNAIYYFNPDTATSKWIWSRPQIKKIGKHIFCK